ncbi:MAG TPA: pentapeptide repeat-containing protein [Ignavibacteria bacterium]
MKKLFTSIIDFFKPLYFSIKSFWGTYKFQTLLSCIIILAIILILNYIYKIGFVDFYNELRDKDKPFYIVHIAIVLAAIATAIFTWWKNIINQRLSNTEESTRQDSLYAKAVDFLKETNDLITRKGGVHILKDLAVTSPQQAQKCIDLLCSLNESWMPKFLNDYPNFFETNKNFPNIKNIEEIKRYKTKDEKDLNQFVYYFEDTKKYIDNISLSQLVLQTVSEIIKYISKNYEYKSPYDFSYKFLCSINLNDVDFKNKFNFENANLQSAQLKEVNLQSADLFRANLQSAELFKADLQSADLHEANLQYAALDGANLQSAKLWRVNLQYAILDGANLQSTILNGANLQSASLWNANLQSANLNSADLQSAHLKGANLQSADLHEANLQSANLWNANLQYATLYRTNLQSARLWAANLQYTKLSKNDLQFADLNEANLKFADIDKANFTKANLLYTDFRNAKNIDKAIFDENKKEAIFTDEDFKRLNPPSPTIDTEVKK